MSKNNEAWHKGTSRTAALSKLLVIGSCLWLACKLVHIFWPFQGRVVLRSLVECLKSGILTLFPMQIWDLYLQAAFSSPWYGEVHVPGCSTWRYYSGIIRGPAGPRVWESVHIPAKRRWCNCNIREFSWGFYNSVSSSGSEKRDLSSPPHLLSM